MRGMSDEEIDKEYNSGSLLAYRSGTRAFFLNIKNPKNRHYTGTIGMENSYTDSNVGNNDGQKITVNNTKEVEYVVYSPNQIKSATANTGMFSTENDDIQMAIDTDYVTDLVPFDEKNSYLLETSRNK